MKKIIRLVSFICLLSAGLNFTGGCTFGPPPIPSSVTPSFDPTPLSSPYSQSMSYLYAENLPWKVAGFPMEEQVLSPTNLFAPTFTLKNSSKEVVSEGSINFEIELFEDKDGDPISFWWKAREGKFVFWNPSVRFVTWQAPKVEKDRDIPIYILAADGRGKETQQILWVKVKTVSKANDLMISDLRYYPIEAPVPGNPPVYYPGETVTAEWVVTNFSPQRIMTVMTGIWITSETNVPNTRPYYTDNTGSMEPGDQIRRKTSFRLPSDIMPNYYYLAFQVDFEQKALEPDEENNKAYLLIWVRPKNSPRR